MAKKIIITKADHKSSVTYQKATASFSYRLLRGTEIKLDPFLLWQRLSDSTTLSDSPVVAMHWQRSYAATQELTDSPSVSYGKAVSDSVTLGESASIVTTWARSFTESATLSDSPAASYGKVTTESITFSETHASSYGAVKTDSVTLGDSFVSAMAFNPSFTDAFTLDDSAVVDAFTKDISAVKGNITTMQDTAAFTYSKPFTDTFSVGESFAYLMTSASGTVNGSQFNFGPLNE